MLEKMKRCQVRLTKTLDMMGPKRIVKRLYEAEMEGRREQEEPRKKME